MQVIKVKSFKESYDDNVRYNENLLSEIRAFSVWIDQSVSKIDNSIHYGTGNVRDFADTLEENAKQLIELSKKLKNQEE